MKQTLKTIIFVPPNACSKKHDFVFERLAEYFVETLKYEVIYIALEDKTVANTPLGVKYIEVETLERLFESIASIKHDYIISRGWMHAYTLSAKLVEKFSNTIVLIKDWNFANREEYKFLFGDDKDFDAIEYIFKHAKKILSHYTEEQAISWAEEYGVDAQKFVFFPEYCSEKNFIHKVPSFNPQKVVDLVFAGTLPPSSAPEEFYLSKGLLRMVSILSKQDIRTNVIVPPQQYEMMKTSKAYQDFFYKDRFDESFHLYKGEILNAAVLQRFTFSFFILEYTTKSTNLNKYAVPSKFAFYLEAGVPIVINNKLKALAKIVFENNLGVVFSNEELPKLGDILHKITETEYAVFVKNIHSFRKNYTQKEFKWH